MCFKLPRMNTVASDELQKNHEFARRINRETRQNPDSPYGGKFVGIAGERVVVVADLFDDADAELNALGFGRDDCLMTEVSADYDSPIVFCSSWGMQVIENETGIRESV